MGELGDEFAVGGFDVYLVDNGILHGGVYLAMAQDLLHLLYGHAFVDSAGGHGAAEFVGMDSFKR